jgi:hypothetical protein
MASCDQAHKALDKIANGNLQSGKLPKWSRVQGKTAWWVYQGPMRGMPGAWETFLGKIGSEQSAEPAGPCGDVYACSPMAHVADRQRKMLTILYMPVA